MYFYYCLATFGYQPYWKRYLTSLQILQFLLAGSMGCSYMFIKGCARTKTGAEYTLVEYLSHGFVVVYVVPLTVLFIDFAKKSYYSGGGKLKVGAKESYADVAKYAPKPAPLVEVKTRAPKKRTTSKLE